MDLTFILKPTYFKWSHPVSSFIRLLNLYLKPGPLFELALPTACSISLPDSLTGISNLVCLEGNSWSFSSSLLVLWSSPSQVLATLFFLLLSPWFLSFPHALRSTCQQILLALSLKDMDNPTNSPIISSTVTILEKPPHCSKVINSLPYFSLAFNHLQFFSVARVIVFNCKSYSVIPLLKSLQWFLISLKIKNQSPHNQLQGSYYLAFQYFWPSSS